MKCGYRTTDDAKKCNNCGATFPSMRPDIKDFLSKLPTLNSPKYKEMVARIGKLALPVAAVIIVILIFIFGIVVPNTGAKGALKKYFSAIENQNVQKYIAVMPEGEKQIYDIVEGTELEEEVEDKLKDTIESLEEKYGDKIKISLKITKVDDMTSKELKVIKSAYKLDEDLELIEIEEGVEIDFDIEYKGEDDSESGDGVAYVIKEDGKWKVYEVETDI